MINPEATERFMAAPWLGEVDPEEKRAILEASVGVRATSDVWMLSLYHPAHEALRREHPRAAEALAVAILRALSERFDLMDRLLTDYFTRKRDGSARTSEWSSFRARLFDESGL